MNTPEHSEPVASCHKCGHPFPDEWAGNSAIRTPCPTCGSRSIAIGVTFASSVQIHTSVSVELAVRHVGKNWQKRWNFLKQGLDQLLQPIQGGIGRDEIEAAAHRVAGLYVEMYNFKDALKEEAASLGIHPQDVESRINSDARLALIADLANTEKHAALNNPPRSGYKPVILGLSGISDASNGGWHLKMQISHGTANLDGVQSAKDGMQAWEDALKDWRLI